MRIHSFALRCFTVLGLGSLLLSGCSTDLDPNADYKETIVMYSLLNPTDKTHLVKVNKAFLNTNTNAVTIAATNPDSTTFKPEELTVKLERLSPDSTILNTYLLERYVSKTKAPGTFFSDSSAFYRTLPNQPGTLDENSIYRVVATSNRTGLSASAAVNLVKQGRFCIRQVSNRPPGGCLDTVGVAATSAYEPQKQGNAISFIPPDNAYIYSAKVEFPYTETTNGVSVNKSVSWYVRNNHLQNPSAEPWVTFPIDDNTFYVNIANQINTQNDNATTKRTTDGKIIVSVTAGSELLALNYRANTSYSIFSQTRPEFTNVRNGTGLVASRTKKVVYAALTVAAKDVLKRDTRLKFQ